MVKSDQTITFAALPNQVYGAAPFALSATASSGLPVSFGIVSGPATLSGSTLTITGAGTVTVRASQSGDATWNPALPVDQSFGVGLAPLTVRADDKTRVYGATNPLFTVSYSGFVNGDDTGLLNGSPSLSATQTFSISVIAPPPIQFTRLGDQLQLSWQLGTLQEADDVQGPYHDVSTQSPFIIDLTETRKFYRIRF